MVKTNKPTHQRGKGLFISRRSPSHTWPVVLSLWNGTFLRAVIQSSSSQAAMLATEMAAMHTDQRLFVKSLIQNPLGNQSCWKGSCAASSNWALLRLEKAHTKMPTKVMKLTTVAAMRKVVTSMAGFLYQGALTGVTGVADAGAAGAVAAACAAN